jgi:hypothetical protein
VTAPNNNPASQEITGALLMTGNPAPLKIITGDPASLKIITGDPASLKIITGDPASLKITGALLVTGDPSLDAGCAYAQKHVCHKICCTFRTHKFLTQHHVG